MCQPFPPPLAEAIARDPSRATSLLQEKRRMADWSFSGSVNEFLFSQRETNISGKRGPKSQFFL